MIAWRRFGKKERGCECAIAFGIAITAAVSIATRKVKGDINGDDNHGKKLE